jgi:hypothetical protein
MSTKAKLDTKAFVMNLDNKPIKLEDKDLEFGRAFALVLISGSKSADPLRAYNLARKLSDSTEPIELDSSEVAFIKEAMTNFTGFTTLVMGQLYEKLQ